MTNATLSKSNTSGFHFIDKNKQQQQNITSLGLGAGYSHLSPLHLKDIYNCEICLYNANAQFQSTHQNASGWNEFAPSERWVGL